MMRVARIVIVALLLAMPAAITAWASAAATPRLVEVRAAHHPGFDRIVFEFKGPVPDIARVQWATDLRLDPSHQPARVRGDAFLRVRFFPALGHDPKPPHRSTFGSARRAYALPGIVHVVLLGDSEGEVSFGIGLKKKTAILRATKLTRPSRFVVDVATRPDERAAEPTTRVETTVTSDLLPGVALVTQEVEPGVLRVVNDGVRDLSSAWNAGIVAGHDGGIWIRRAERFLRLGVDGTHEWPAGHRAFLGDLAQFEVAPDGTVWALLSTPGDHRIRSFDGEGWTAHQVTAYKPSIAIAPDGTVWAASWVDPEQGHGSPSVFGYLGDDGWQQVGGWDFVDGRLFAPGTGDIWAIGSERDVRGIHLHRFVDGVWQTYDHRVKHADVGVDGTAWGVAPGWRLDEGFVRFDGTEWMAWGPPFRMAGMDYERADLSVAPDRSVWAATPVCGRVDGGVVRFDGTTWDRYLPNHCVEAIDSAADGAVWLLARKRGDDNGPIETYVIRPEAAAATE